METWGESQVALGDTVTATITIIREHASEYRGFRRRCPCSVLRRTLLHIIFCSTHVPGDLSWRMFRYEDAVADGWVTIGRHFTTNLPAPFCVLVPRHNVTRRRSRAAHTKNPVESLPRLWCPQSLECRLFLYYRLRCAERMSCHHTDRSYLACVCLVVFSLLLQPDVVFRRPESEFLKRGEPWWVMLAGGKGGETLISLTPMLVENLGSDVAECKVRGSSGVVRALAPWVFMLFLFFSSFMMA